MTARPPQRPETGESRDDELRVLIASAADLSRRLGKTVLWRSDIERVFAGDADSALEMARTLSPRLAVIDVSGLADARKLMRRLRGDDTTRHIPIAAIAGPGKNGEGELRKAGADVVVPSSIDLKAVERQLEELLSVPPRREMRLPASFQLWCRSEPTGDLKEAVVLNLSVRGMLIETAEALPNGSTVEIRLPLPGDEEPLPLMGLVERQVRAPEGRFQSGLQFLILRDQTRERIRAFIEAEVRE